MGRRKDHLQNFRTLAILNHLDVAEEVAHHFYRQGKMANLSMDDLLGEARLLLIRAYDTYQQERTRDLATWVKLIVYRGLARYCRESDLIRIPSTSARDREARLRLWQQCRCHHSDFKSEFSDLPGPAEKAEQLDEGRAYLREQQEAEAWRRVLAAQERQRQRRQRQSDYRAVLRFAGRLTTPERLALRLLIVEQKSTSEISRKARLSCDEVAHLRKLAAQILADRRTSNG